MLIRVLGFVRLLALLGLFMTPGQGQVGYAQTPSPDFLLVNPPQNEVGPGETINLVIRAVHPGEDTLKYTLETLVPEGWSAVGNQSVLVLEPKTSRIKLMPVHIHPKTAVGDYSVSILCRSLQDQTLTDTLKAFIRVKPEFAILLRETTGPAYVTAGDTLTCVFSLQNLSNTEAEIALEKIFTHQILEDRLKMNPGEQRDIRLHYISDPDIGFLARQSVSLNARVIGVDKTKVSGSHVFDVLPLREVEKQQYH